MPKGKLYWHILVSTWKTVTWTSEWERLLENNIGFKLQRKTCSVDAVSGSFFDGKQTLIALALLQLRFQTITLAANKFILTWNL